MAWDGLNADQRSWVQHLASLPPEEKCACGWNLRGRCFGSCYGDASKGGFVKTLPDPEGEGS